MREGCVFFTIGKNYPRFANKQKKLVGVLAV